MDMDFVGAFELEYGRMVDFSRIIVLVCIRTTCSYYVTISTDYVFM